MKKLFGLLCVLVAMSFGAFAEEKKSSGFDLAGKLNIGYATGASYVDINGISGYATMSGFELYPALVITPDATAMEGKPFNISFEAALDMIFGSSDYYKDYKVTAITPSVSVLFNYQLAGSDFLEKLVPYAGINLGVPIQKSTFTGITYNSEEHKYEEKEYSGTKIGLGMGFVAGARYAINDKIEVNAETGYNFFNLHDFFIRGGAVYHFQKK